MSEHEMKKSHTLPGVIVTRSKEPLVICMGCGEKDETIERYKQALDDAIDSYTQDGTAFEMMSILKDALNHKES